MTISLSQLRKVASIEKVVIHSLDLMLYQASVVIDGKEEYVTDDAGKLLRSHNLLGMQIQFEHMNFKSMVLRQQSAYDEMVGQPVRGISNSLEVPIGNMDLAIRPSDVKSRLQ